MQSDLSPIPQFCYPDWWQSLSDANRAAIIRDPNGWREKIFRAGYSAAISAMPDASGLVEALAEVFTDHDKVNSLDWTNRAGAALAAHQGAKP